MRNKFLWKFRRWIIGWFNRNFMKIILVTEDSSVGMPTES